MRDRVLVALNLVTLLIGLAVGYALGFSAKGLEAREYSQVPPAASAPSQSPPQAPTEQFEEVAPVITAGSAGFGVVLTGRLAADEVGIRGVDVLKLLENIINVLGSKRTVFTTAELQSAIDRSKIARPLRMKPQGKEGGQ